MNVDLDAVHRLRPLPSRPARGRLFVPAQVIEASAAALLGSRGTDGAHEGLVFWAGWQLGIDTAVAFAVVPGADHGWGHVRADESAMLAATRSARSRGAALLVQVHSHPGRDVRHSDGDDKLVHMPFEGMWSVVVGNYGSGLAAETPNVGLHQFQDGRWARVDNTDEALIVLPPVIRP